MLEAFAAGAARVEGGAAAVCHPELPRELGDGAAAFYGVTPETRALWLEAKRQGRRWYYLDNSYFDGAREVQFRVTRDAVQAMDLLPPAPERLARLGVRIEAWKKGGRHIVVCPQSDEFMRVVCAWPGGADGWQEDVLQQLNAHTDRPLVVRHWMRNKAQRSANLHEDLKGAYALVTHMSAAANMALLAGIPVFCTGMCAASPLAGGELKNIARPKYAEGRAEWAAGLAGAQWTEAELRDGTAWRALQ